MDWSCWRCGSSISRFTAVLAMTALLSACASFSPDGGMDVVSVIARKNLNTDAVAIRTEADASDSRATVRRLLTRPLTADNAVAIALLNNKGLQASYDELGLAETRRIGDSLPSNPSISLTSIGGAAEWEIERKVTADILALVTLPLRSEIATDRFHQAQLRAALETLRVASEARTLFYRAVAAREIVALLRRAKAAAESTAQVALQLGKTGALNKLDQAREQSFYAETTADLANAVLVADTERERLTRVLGLWGSDLNFRLPDILPRLPKKPKSRPLIEVEAIRHRADLQIARIELATLAKSYGLANATRFINVLEAGGDFKTTKDREAGKIVRDRGFEASFQIPIFDFGEVRVRQAEQIYLQAANRLVEKAVNVRSEAREAYRRYRLTYDIAQHYQREILPLRKIISDENQLRFSSMLIDVFALLTEAKERIAANKAAIEAKREFWLSDAALLATVAGSSTNDGAEPMRASVAGANR